MFRKREDAERYEAFQLTDPPVRHETIFDVRGRSLSSTWHMESQMMDDGRGWPVRARS